MSDDDYDDEYAVEWMVSTSVLDAVVTNDVVDGVAALSFMCD